MIYRLIYCSTATALATTEDMHKLIELSKANNAQHNISGVFAYNSRFFLQGFEGARELVNELYARIQRDPRNQHVVLVKYTQTPERRWQDWHAKFLMPTEDTANLLRRFTTQNLFNPYTMHPDSAERLLTELSVMD